VAHAATGVGVAGRQGRAAERAHRDRRVGRGQRDRRRDAEIVEADAVTIDAERAQPGLGAEPPPGDVDHQVGALVGAIDHHRRGQLGDPRDASGHAGADGDRHRRRLRRGRGRGRAGGGVDVAVLRARGGWPREREGADRQRDRRQGRHDGLQAGGSGARARPDGSVVRRDPYPRGGGLGGATAPRATHATGVAGVATITSSRTAAIGGGSASATDASVTSALWLLHAFIDGVPSPRAPPAWPAGQSTQPQSRCASWSPQQHVTTAAVAVGSVTTATASIVTSATARATRWSARIDTLHLWLRT
jgi:hypothetical protein